MKRTRILIVDDDRDLAESLADFVDLHGHEATIAGNGQKAVDHHAKNRFDITFMDMRMPVLNGIDGFFEIRKMRPTPSSETGCDAETATRAPLGYAGDICLTNCSI